MTKQGAEVNEAHCLRVLCSHPCCWDTEHRCARGILRHTPAQVKRSSPRDDDLPSLSIVNVSEWVGRRRPLYKAHAGASLNDVTSLTKQSKDSEMMRRADLSSSRSFSSIPTNEAKKMVKLNTINISPLIGYSEMPKCPVVMWNPNPHHVPQWLNQNKFQSPNVAIKELTCPTFPKPSKVTAEERLNWQVQRRQANLRKRFNHRKWRDQRGRNSTLEGAGSPLLTEDVWVGIGFNPISKIPPHHISRSLLFQDTGCGSLEQKLPSLTTPHPNHCRSVSPLLSLSLRSMKF
ncbi:uncharacterized protein LOC130440011 isoform X2 [Triplophysa dalaica]|uniref:uncharacterized protein LOC130440011 isoform X2 n=1 Tax=Triplophysa dalaica TaxID=1582913 RepID=UPI0024E0384C|nr:uncharacterized protein LOC130440011 isoform X2 [Triplophysa dalaica]